MPILKPHCAFPQPLAIALLAAAIAPACGGSAKSDASADRPLWPWDVQPAPDSGAPDLASDPAQSIDARAAADLAISTDAPTLPDDTLANSDAATDDSLPDGNDDLPDPGISYLCTDGYFCQVSCENRCGLHDLGRSVCTCTASTLHCTDCVLTDLARPQVPQIVSAVCGDGIATDVPCARVGDACFLHPAWPYPDGCLCWPTDHGMVWGCAPVFGWFTSTPQTAASGTGTSAAAAE